MLKQCPPVKDASLAKAALCSFSNRESHFLPRGFTHRAAKPGLGEVLRATSSRVQFHEGDQPAHFMAANAWRGRGSKAYLMAGAPPADLQSGSPG